MHEERRSRTLPGDEGVWFFIAADVIFFLLLFGSFVSERIPNADMYSASQETLSIKIGAWNAFNLVTSSWFVAAAVRALRFRNVRNAHRLLSVGIALGGLFLGLKGYEYAGKISEGHTIISNGFFYVLFRHDRNALGACCCGNYLAAPGAALDRAAGRRRQARIDGECSILLAYGGFALANDFSPTLFGAIVMRELKATFWIWGALIAVTVLSYSVTQSGVLNAGWATTLMVLAAGYKARLVVIQFMELKSAPAGWRYLFEGWIIACCVLIIRTYVVIA